MSTPPGPPRPPAPGAGDPEPEPDLHAWGNPAAGLPGDSSAGGPDGSHHGGSGHPHPAYGSPHEGYGQHPQGYGHAAPAYGQQAGPPGDPAATPAAHPAYAGQQPGHYGYYPGQPGYGQADQAGYGQATQPGYPAQPGHGAHLPAHGYPAGPPPGPPTPKRQRSKVVPIVVSVAIVALIGATVWAVLSFQAAEREAEELRQQQEEADRAAEEFFAALEAHEEVWSDEAVQATFGVDVADAFSPIHLEASELDEPAADLVQACADHEEAVAAFEALESSTRPELADVPGTSDSYQSAQSAANHSGFMAESEQEYLQEGRDLSDQLLAYCQPWSAGVSTASSAHTTYEDRVQALLVPEGEGQDEGDWTLECTEVDGCLPLVRSDREEYADATVEYYQTLHEVRTDLFTDHCLNGYEEYCEAELALSQVQLDHANTSMDLLRGSLGTGSEALPGYNNALQDWDEEVQLGREELADLLTQMDSDVPDHQVEHFSIHQYTELSAWQQRIADLARQTLVRHEPDEA